MPCKVFLFPKVILNHTFIFYFCLLKKGLLLRRDPRLSLSLKSVPETI